jgi:lariat debranching enzyme
MGSARVINFGTLQIAGISGVFNERPYNCVHHETPPYDLTTVKSAYCVQDLEVYRLKVC